MSFDISENICGHVAVLSYKGFDISMTTGTRIPELLIFDNNNKAITEFGSHNVTVEDIADSSWHIDVFL